MPISLTTFARTIHALETLQKDTKVEVNILPESNWVNNELTWFFPPQFNGVTSLAEVASICGTLGWYIQEGQLMAHDSVMNSLKQAFNTKSMQMVAPELTKKIQSPVKYFYNATANFRKFGFATVYPMCIVATPTEVHEGERHYRIVAGVAPSMTNIESYHPSYFVVDDNSPYYNYLDVGHVIFFCSSPDGRLSIFIANQLSLNVYPLIAILSLLVDRAKPFLRHDVFLPAQNSGELQRLLQAAEQKIPEVKGLQYNKLKQDIRADFELHAQNAVVSKFLRKETDEITLNNIRISNDTATYETISISAPDIATTVFNKLDPNSVFDIYQLVDSYIGCILQEADKLGTYVSKVNGKSRVTGFVEAKQWTFNINEITITLSLSNTNTRRKVNGYCINVEELPRVLRRATCYTTLESYNQFLRQISRASLRVHDALANGVPIKILSFDKYGRDYTRAVTSKHPKMFFIYEDGVYYLWLDKARTQRVPLKRFVGLLDEIRVVNRQTDNGWYSHGIDEANGPVGGGNRRNSDWCRWKLERVIRGHAVDEAGVCSVTPEQFTTLFDWLLEARTLAERKSQELLADVVKSTGAKPVTYQDLEAYEVQGKSGRNYVVEKESFKVWDAKTKSYICIVDGRGEMGIGYDALVARLLALANDTVVVDKIGTLRTPINAQQMDNLSVPAIANA